MAQLEDLRQAVRHEDDRTPGGGYPADRGEHRRALDVRQGRRRLVEDHQPGTLAQRLGDLGELLLADAESGQRLVRVDALQAHVVEYPAASGDSRAPPVDQR